MIGYPAACCGVVHFGPKEATANKWHIEDVDKDGKSDMIFQFETQLVGIHYGNTQACLNGRTKSGVNIQGCDGIRIVGN